VHASSLALCKVSGVGKEVPKVESILARVCRKARSVVKGNGSNDGIPGPQFSRDVMTTHLSDLFDALPFDPAARAEMEKGQ
jgi:hypothetical protein